MGGAILTRLMVAWALAGAVGIPDALAQANRAVIAPAQPGTTAQPLRNGFNLPPAGETRFVPSEVMLDIPAGVSTQTLDVIAARHRMTRLETRSFRLTGRTLHRWRLDGGGTVMAMIRGLASERDVAGAQPNYVYALQQDGLPPADLAQYAVEKLDLPEAHRLATGARILVALIDSGVDASHPALAGAVTADFDAAADEGPHPHGTGMAGAIAARHNLLGVAPRVGLLTVRAFSSMADSSEGTTFNIIKGLDWAAERSARIVNMSFAGPPDPRLHDALLKAARKGMVLIAAGGHPRPKKAPRNTAADPPVNAVTATDAKDALFPRANRGDYIAVAAPGVDVLVPAPDGTYQLTTGTSVAAAEVSGVAALLIERNPSLTPKDVRAILMRTARGLGPKGHDQDFGAGLVNAFKAVSAVRSK
jgi:subtilisin family serine protease